MPSRRPAITIVQCADYGGSYRGSFVPMMTAAAREADRRGYSNAVVLSEVARDRPWLREIEDLAEVRLVATDGPRRALVGRTMRVLDRLLADRSRPGVIHTHFVSFDMPAALMRLRRSELAVFWHQHGPLLDDPRVRLRNALRYQTLGRLVDGMLCVSPELRAELEARHAPAGRLADFPNAIDADRFSAISAAERAQARRALGLTEEDRVVLQFCWNWYFKGGDLLLAAAELLADSADIVVLTVLGEDDDRPELASRPNVRVLSPTDDVRRLYAAADVFLSTSRIEGAPLAVLEALACGLPVVATNLPVQERSLHGLPGARSVQPRPEAIVGAVRELLALGPETRAAHESQARRRFEASFSLEAWARRLVDLYERTIEA